MILRVVLLLTAIYSIAMLVFSCMIVATCVSPLDSLESESYILASSSLDCRLTAGVRTSSSLETLVARSASTVPVLVSWFY